MKLDKTDKIGVAISVAAASGIIVGAVLLLFALILEVIMRCCK